MDKNTHHNALPKGYKLHWYVIESVLGRGGFGITYMALDTNLNRTVAIKEFLPLELCYRDNTDSINPLTQEDGEQYRWGLERFISEAQTLAQFEHHNIVRVIAVFEENNTGYMVMDYEKGEELNAILKRKKTLTEPELISVLQPILDGIDKVHETGFIHRDIKPQNIIIRPDGSPVLIDFGSARQALGGKTKTLTSMVTPGYAPFEQYYSKSDKQGPWTDIYAMAATAYRCITGKVPLSSVDRSEAILQGQADYIVRASEIGKGKYSKALLKAIDHGLEFNPKDRPQTIANWRHEFSKTRGARAIQVNAAGDVPTQVAGTMQTRVVQPHSGIPASSTSSKESIRLLMVLLLIALMAPAWYFSEEIRRFLFPVHDISVTENSAAGIDTPVVETELTETEKPEPARPAMRGVEVQQDIIDSINDHLQKAEQAMADNKLLVPTRESALHHYTQVLMMDRQNAMARTGIQSVVSKLLDQAADALQDNEFYLAQQKINSARALDRNSTRAKHLQEQLLARQEAERTEQARIEAEQEALAEGAAEEELKQEEISSLLQLAGQDMEALRLTSPAGGNAFERYQKVLELDTGNTEAQLGLQAITDKYIEIAQKYIEQNEYENALTLLDKAEQVTPESENIEIIRNEVEILQQKEQEELARLELEKKKQEEEQSAEEARLAEEKKQEEAAKVAAAEQLRESEMQQSGSDSALGEFVRIPGGEFDISGNPVTVDTFSLAKHEVTIGQWKQVMGKAHIFNDSCDECAVTNISRALVMEFIGKINSESGYKYRLPTAAEWLYACEKGGNNRNCEGNNISAAYIASGNLVNVKNQAEDKSGIAGMGGKVYELTCSKYSENYQPDWEKCLDSSDSSNISVVFGRKKSMDTVSFGYWRQNVRNIQKLTNTGFRLAASDGNLQSKTPVTAPSGNTGELNKAENIKSKLVGKTFKSVYKGENLSITYKENNRVSAKWGVWSSTGTYKVKENGNVCIDYSVSTWEDACFPYKY